MKNTFEITLAPFGKIHQCILKNNFTGEFIAIIPSFGATINQIALQKNDVLHQLIDGCETYEELITEGKNKFKGCKLYPFPNRIENGKYIFQNKEYQLPLNFAHENNSIHGLVCEEAFAVIKQESREDYCLLSVEYSTTENDAGYPFKTNITIEFILNKEGFTAKTIIKNTDSKEVPIGDGWHPYFKTGSAIDDCLISLPVDCHYEVNTKMIPTGNKIKQQEFISQKKIDNHFFDTGFKVKDNTAIAQTIIEDPKKNIQLVIWQETGINEYNYLQIYTPPDRKSIAIEPMTCLTNAFNNNEGLIILPPNEEVNFSFGVRLK